MGELEPKSDRRRKTEETIEAVAAAVPFAGGVLSVKYAQAFRRADQRRFEKWQQQIEAALDAIGAHGDGIEIDTLFNDDRFVDALATATRIAEKSAATEKRVALQNIMFNVGVGESRERDKQAIYLRYVDELTPSHIALLSLVDNPPGWFEARGRPQPGGGLLEVVKSAFPTWAHDEDFIDTLASDLASHGFTDALPLRVMMTPAGVMARRTKPKGHEFMAFISGPFDAGPD